MTYGFFVGCILGIGDAGGCTSFSDFLGLLNRPIGCFGKLIVVLVYDMANINVEVLICQEKNILFEK